MFNIRIVLFCLGEETVSGEYPLLKAFLSYMIQTCKDNSCLPGILLIAREILPGLANWRYQTASDRELILKLCLQTLLAFVNNVKDGNNYVLFFSLILLFAHIFETFPTPSFICN